jgi:hypothetical protein
VYALVSWPKCRSGPLTRYGRSGDDDYFSSDLPDEKLVEFWGNFWVPVLILPSENDEHVPEGIDFKKLMARWMSVCKPGVASDLSALIPKANHCVDGDEAQAWLSERVIAFLRRLE